MMKILVLWGNWGPYHYARFQALHELGQKHGLRVEGLELFPSSGYYDWKTAMDHPAVHHLKVGNMEMEFNPRLLATRFLPLLVKIRPDVIFVPSYWHWSLFANYAGRLMGARIVMMNESHRDTEKARGLKRALKKMIVRGFHAGFVGGSPHRRHFASLGLAESKIFPGYDAVDNSYFTRRSQEAREDAAALREKFELPQQYFLNLGRMVPKKNLSLLIRAYSQLMQSQPDLPHDLVLVGSGEEESSLHQLCTELGLAVADHTRSANQPSRARPAQSELAVAGSANDRPSGGLSGVEHRDPTVHFYGFRQIEENPVFYALASAFILPSTTEEWGLVVNEAMACGLPVLVSNRVGCSEDLVHSGQNGFTFDPKSVEELTEALQAVAEPGPSERMGAESLRIVSDWGCERFANGGLKAAFAATGKPAEQPFQ